MHSNVSCGDWPIQTKTTLQVQAEMDANNFYCRKREPALKTVMEIVTFYQLIYLFLIQVWRTVAEITK